MSFTMIISSKSAPGTTEAIGVASTSIPAKISRYMSATRRGVSFTPSRSGSSPIPSRTRRTPAWIFSSSNGIGRLLRGDQVLEGPRELLQVGELGGPRQLARLADAVDPHRCQAELLARRDVVEQARRHVRVPLAIGIRHLEEPLPVPVRGLVRAGLRGGDPQVDLDRDQRE